MRAILAGDGRSGRAQPAPATGASARELEVARAALAELVDQLSFESFDEGKLLHVLVLDRGRERGREPSG